MSKIKQFYQDPITLLQDLKEGEEEVYINVDYFPYYVTMSMFDVLLTNRDTQINMPVSTENYNQFYILKDE